MFSEYLLSSKCVSVVKGLVEKPDAPLTKLSAMTLPKLRLSIMCSLKDTEKDTLLLWFCFQ